MTQASALLAVRHCESSGQAPGAPLSAAGYAAEQLAEALSSQEIARIVLQRIDARVGFADWQAMRNPDVFRIECAGDGTLRFERAPSAALRAG